ncbi:flotillin family protein [Mycolicibacterium austroafricanum]|uniref:flotillin family protein n=1 Tax=Mycolicibacterium austroafricanum TaxID=39687 RepID=UPI001CA35EF1|nr:flotillin family protein [Mycolicibacterium austroafricanum]QZT63436.1 flotillin family protein [Mycolicibacterium austroafricanum]
MSVLLITVIAGIAALLLFVALPIVYVKNYIKVPPNEVAVFTGRGQPKVVRGGARFRVPGIERVDIMSLEPFNVSINLQNALSNNGVPVNVEAVGLVRIGSADEAVQTAVQRFLTSDLNELQRQINEILAGSLRGITATMTVEDLNSNRDTLARSVVDEAGGDLARIGMEVDVLKIAGISDRNGYLESLGQRRIAEVKRDATVGTAEAERDAQIQSAKARQAGAVAQAEADTAIATANQKRDVELARLRAQTEAENAQADQAGPLANARAQKDVGIAIEQAEAARVQARIEVEQRRAEQSQAALQADVIAPAEAQRAADIARAEGQRQATILAGQAEADARKAAADALRVERQAEADGIKARLVAEAAGKKEIAAALNTYSPEAARLQTLPDVLQSVVKATEAAAMPLSEIERLSIIGGASDAQDAVGGLLGVSPLAVAKIVETLKSSGIDVAAMLNRSPEPPTAPAEGDGGRAAQPL